VTANVYGAADRVAKAGDTMTGPLNLAGTPPLQIASGASAGDVLTSDGAGNASWQPGVNASALGWVNANAPLYGAVGNGTTDNTAALTAALAAAAPTGPFAQSTTVYLGPGYYVTGPLVIPHGVTLRGAGPRSTTLIAKAGMAAGPLITNAVHAEMVCVMDLRLQGNAQNQTNTVNGLLFSGNWTYSSGTDEYNDIRCRAINLHIEYFTGDGIQSLYRHDSIFQNIQVWEVGGNGFYSTNDDYISNVDCANCGLDGFLLAGNSLITNCKAWFAGWSGNTSTVTSSATTTGSGFHITAGDGGTISNCYAQDNGRNGFFFDGTANVSATGLVADSNNNNSSALSFAGFEFANYAGPLLVSGHTWDRGANAVHQASAVRFNPAAPPGGVALELTWVPTATMGTLLSSDTTAANLELNSVKILNSGGIGSTTYGPQTYYGGVTVDTLKATTGAAAGYVLTSDGSGNGTWKKPAGQGSSSSPAPLALAETAPRLLVTNSTMALTSGTLYLAEVWLQAGIPVTNWNWVPGTTGSTTATHWWGCVLDSARVLRAVTADQLTATITASSVETVALASSYTPPTSGVYYWGLLVAATSMPTSAATSSVPGGSIMIALPPAGTSTTGLTTPGTVGSTTYAAISATGVMLPYGYLS
jgi:hypothetical protein